MRETLGEYVHSLRTKNNLTLTKAAAALDIDQSTLSKIENNKRSFAFETIPKIAKLFGLDTKNLENEYLSEKIAEIIFQETDSTILLSLAKEKAKYFRIKYLKQGNLNFTK